jgi:hypothetical protein
MDYATRIETYRENPRNVLTHLWMGNVSLRRADALRVGLASESFAGRRHEDRDFGLRCLRAGLRGVFDPSLAATHDYQRSITAFLEDARAQGAELALLHRVHGPGLGPIDMSRLWQDLPVGFRAFVRLAAAFEVETIIVRFLRAVIGLMAVAGWRSMAMRLLKLARRLLLVAGASGHM